MEPYYNQRHKTAPRNDKLSNTRPMIVSKKAHTFNRKTTIASITATLSNRN